MEHQVWKSHLWQMNLLFTWISLPQVPYLSGKANRRWIKIDTHPLFTCDPYFIQNKLSVDRHHFQKDCFLGFNSCIYWTLMEKSQRDEGWIRVIRRRFFCTSPQRPLCYFLDFWDLRDIVKTDVDIVTINIIVEKKIIQCSVFSGGLINPW